MRLSVSSAVPVIGFIRRHPHQVQGKITRILVGPDASKDKLKGSLGELKQLSGLSGVVMGYTPN